MSKNNGGQAFPSFALAKEISKDSWTLASPGMSLRDWFAGMAMQGLFSKFGEPADVVTQSVPVSEDAYKIADSMIAERERRGDE